MKKEGNKGKIICCQKMLNYNLLINYNIKFNFFYYNYELNEKSVN